MDQVPPKNPSIQEKTLIEDNGVDLISNLPDDILCRILSKLPTKYAVGTSILSTRWKPLFSSIPYPCLDFDDTLILQGATGLDSYSDERINCFVNFVYRVMDVILKDVPFVYEFRLKCVHDYEDYQVMDWVNAALACHVMRLVLACNVDDPPCLFESLSGSASLTYLQLEGSIIDATASFSLPNLKHLVLEDAYCYSKDSLLPLVSGCPELEDLTMRYTSYGERDTLTISIPSLKYLIIEYCSNLEVPCTLELDTPKLELLFYTDNVAKGFTVKNLSSLQKAHIDFRNYEFLWEGEFSQYGQNVADLVTGCSSVDSLYMSKFTLTMSSFFYASGRLLPMFGNLKDLLLGGFDTVGWELLPEILDSAPNLEFLFIKEGFYEEKGCYERFLSSLPVDVPFCLSSHLKKIEIWGFMGEEDEFKLVEYFLKNAKVLNEMKVSCDVSSEAYFSTMKKYFSLKSISISKTCKLWISRDD